MQNQTDILQFARLGAAPPRGAPAARKPRDHAAGVGHVGAKLAASLFTKRLEHLLYKLCPKISCWEGQLLGTHLFPAADRPINSAMPCYRKTEPFAGSLYAGQSTRQQLLEEPLELDRETAIGIVLAWILPGNVTARVQYHPCKCDCNSQDAHESLREAG